VSAAGRSYDSRKIPTNFRRRLDQHLIRQFDNHRDICSTRAPTRELILALVIFPQLRQGSAVSATAYLHPSLVIARQEFGISRRADLRDDIREELTQSDLWDELFW
jgi:hypothetical protein